MIRFFIGLLMVFGIVGGLDNMPLDPSYSYLFWQGFFLAAGFGLMLSSVSKFRGQ